MNKVKHGKVQHEMSTSRNKCYSKIVQNEKSATRKSAIRKVYNIKNVNLKRVQYETSTARNECNTKKVQHKMSAT